MPRNDPFGLGFDGKCCSGGHGRSSAGMPCRRSWLHSVEVMIIVTSCWIITVTPMSPAIVFSLKIHMRIGSDVVRYMAHATPKFAAPLMIIAPMPFIINT